MALLRHRSYSCKPSEDPNGASCSRGVYGMRSPEFGLSGIEKCSWAKLPCRRGSDASTAAPSSRRSSTSRNSTGGLEVFDDRFFTELEGIRGEAEDWEASSAFSNETEDEEEVPALSTASRRGPAAATRVANPVEEQPVQEDVDLEDDEDQYGTPYDEYATPSEDHLEDLDVVALRLAGRFGETAGATISEARSLLSYKSETEVTAFYAFVDRLVQEYGKAAEFSVQEIRELCRSPAEVRSRGRFIESQLRFIADTVERFGRSAGATARELKTISKHMMQDEVREYFMAVERLVLKHRVHAKAAKELIRTVGLQGAEARLDGARRRTASSRAATGGAMGASPQLPQQRRESLRSLGFKVGDDPTPTEVKRRYRKLAKLWHPDKCLVNYGGGAAVAGLNSGGDVAAKFREIKAAADCLLAAQAAKTATTERPRRPPTCGCVRRTPSMPWSSSASLPARGGLRGRGDVLAWGRANHERPAWN